jgi:hypothetical protein
MMMSEASPFDGDYDDDFEANLESSGATPDGIYLAKVVSLTKEMSSAGNPMWVWEWEITHSENGEVSPFAGHEVRNYCALTAAAMWNLEETLVAIGLAKPGETAKFKKKDAMGRRAKIAVKNEEGRRFPSIEAITAHPQGPGEGGEMRHAAADEDTPF